MSWDGERPADDWVPDRPSRRCKNCMHWYECPSDRNIGFCREADSEPYWLGRNEEWDCFEGRSC